MTPPTNRGPAPTGKGGAKRGGASGAAPRGSASARGTGAPAARGRGAPASGGSGRTAGSKSAPVSGGGTRTAGNKGAPASGGSARTAGGKAATAGGKAAPARGKKAPAGGTKAPAGGKGAPASGIRGRSAASRTQRGSSGNTRPSQPTAAPQWPARPPIDVHDPDGVRLQKLLAAAGVGSRRVCEDLIRQGRVDVDGQVITELGVRIRTTQTVHVDGVRIQLDESRVYLAFNKPLGVVTSMSDDLGRVDVGDFVANRKERLFHVGRLDADTEGLLLLTNDGELAHRLQHPRYGVLKTYLAQIPGPVPRDLGRRLREGIDLDDGPVRVDSFRVVDSRPGKAMVEVVLHEGRKHIVRRMLAEVGHPVITLVRTQVGPIHLGDTKPGRWRNLTSAEVGALYAAADL